ncbi:EFC14 protein, partial [Alcedo cyanopectus]|nr:EFC14 protein [Ceyx cyanopectus]
MKKRKELNALIGLAADGRRKKPAKKGSGHRLLRTEPPASDSESSSEEDEFAGTRGRCGKGDYLRCCKFCYPLCAFVILAACVVACVGLVWMQVALKEDLDAIKEKFRTMESNQKTSFQEIPKLNEDLVEKQKQLEQIETGELGLNKIWINITEINKQISLLTSTVNHLKNNIKSASDLISLPLTVEKLQKASTVNVAAPKHILNKKLVSPEEESVSNFESWDNFLETSSEMFSVVSVESQPEVCPVKLGQSAMLLITRVLQRLGKLPCAGFIFQENQLLHATLEELNNTAVMYRKLNDIKLLNMDSVIGNLSQRVMLLENSPLALNLDKRENSSTSVVSMWFGFVFFVFANCNSVAFLRLIEIIFGTVESSLSTTAKPTDLSRLTSRSADDDTESNRQLRHLSLPGISSIKDLQNLFEKATEDADGKLSYEDLQRLFDSTAQDPQSFKEFDTDGDEKYSLQELRLALGV